MTTTQIQPSPYRVDMGATGTFQGREIGRCRSCKTVIARETRFWSGSKVTCECGQRVALKGIWGNVSVKKECNAVCMGAVGPSCDCSCGGDNHGGGHF